MCMFTSNSNDDISINEAIKVNDYRTVREIIQMGDKESSLKYNKLGWTPLILAAAWNKTMIAKLLLDNGADPDSQDKYQPPVKQRITRNDRYFSKVNRKLPVFYRYFESNKKLTKFFSRTKKDMTSVKMTFQHSLILKPIFVVQQLYFMQR